MKRVACLLGVAAVIGVAQAACGGTESVGLFADADGGSEGGTEAALSNADAAGTIVSNGGATANGAPGGTTTQVACGSVTCRIPEESCCVYESAQPPQYLCVVGTSCPTVDGGGKGTALTCSGAANCPQDRVCCVYELPSKQVASACRVACASNEAQLCDPKAPVSGCSAAAACSSSSVTDWGLPTGYATCGGVGN